MSDDHHEHPATAADARLTDDARCGCPEARLLLNRRAMLGVTATLFSAAFLPDFARADTNSDARLLVVTLRGGMDGLHMVIPKLDPRYRDVRRSLALPFSETLSLGSDFALHPGLPHVHRMYQAGQAVVVPAAGIPLRNRSHFECQDNLENGLPANTANATGWLNRLLGSLPAGDPIRVRRGIEIGGAPLILRGPEPVLGWSPTWFQKSAEENVARLETLYTALDPELWDSLQRGLEADRLALNSGAGNDGDVSQLRKGFIGAARLMRARSGPRVAVLSIDGWDTHAQQGGVTGFFNDRLSDLDLALADLKKELGPAWANTVAICVTEFGRTVNTNGDGGTDHGVGTVALLVGGALKGGIAGDWPGLAQRNLYEGVDLFPAVDLRSVFKGVLGDHLGIPADILEASVFPDSGPAAPLQHLIRSPAPPRPEMAFMTPPSLAQSSPILRYRRRHGLGSLN